MHSRSLGHRAPLLWLVLPFVAGTAAGRAWDRVPPGLELAVAAVGAGSAVALAWRQSRGWAVGLVISVFLAGAAHYQLRNPRAPDWDELPPREATVTIAIQRVFPRTDLTTTGIGTIVDGPGALRQLAGQRIYFSLRRRETDPPPIRSATVVGTGVFGAVPRSASAGTFDGYLASAGVHFRLARGRFETILARPSAYYVFLEHAAGQLNQWLSTGIARKRPDLAAVYRAMMLGQKFELSQEQDEVFMRSGTMHLFAINGLHIGVVAVSLHALLALLRCPRPAAALATLAILWFDVDTTGASPSAVRAFLLVLCYESGFVFRRRANGLAALSAATMLVLFLDPNALFSASFQMSYGVVLTILAFGLPLADHWHERLLPYRDRPKALLDRWQRGWLWFLRHFWPALAIGVAATLVSALTGPQFFSVFAPIGFISNLVLVPLAMLVIIAGFAAIVAGVLGAAGIVVMLNHAALLLLVIINALIRYSITLPGAWWTTHWRTEWGAPLALAALLATVLAGYGWKWEWKRGGPWPPVAVAALALALGIRFG